MNDTANRMVRRDNSPEKPPLEILLAGPRGFCAGVERAILIVEKALDRFGPPVYVRHEIVHNRFVVEQLESKGAVFIDELDDVPDDRPVIFSAHGVPKSVPEEAKRRDLFFVDATCPLVSKVHREAERHHKNGHHVVLIGHAGHPEVIGTMGQLPVGAITLVETVDDVHLLPFATDTPLAHATQTTLSVDETRGIMEALQKRYPQIAAPKKEDICYATTNRQTAIKSIAAEADTVLVIGAPNSSNSKRLVDVARDAGCPNAYLIQRATDIDWQLLENTTRLGITAGASAPEVLVDEVIAACQEHFQVTVSERITTIENVEFKMPRVLVGQ